MEMRGRAFDDGLARRSEEWRGFLFARCGRGGGLCCLSRFGRGGGVGALARFGRGGGVTGCGVPPFCSSLLMAMSLGIRGRYAVRGMSFVVISLQVSHSCRGGARPCGTRP